MAESFLEAQLKRIRALTERISRVRSYVRQLREEHGEFVTNNPLFGVRDYRIVASPAGRTPRQPRAIVSRGRRQRRR